MAEPIPFNELPRPNTPEKYAQRDIEETFQTLERELGQKHDKRGHLYLEPGKYAVLTAASSTSQYGIGINASDHLVLIDMSDGTTADFVVNWEDVDGLEAQLVALSDADDSLTAAVAVNASAIADNDTAIGLIETEITAAREGESSLLAKVQSVEQAIVDGDSAEASARTAAIAKLPLSGNNWLYHTRFNKLSGFWGTSADSGTPGTLLRLEASGLPYLYFASSGMTAGTYLYISATGQEELIPVTAGDYVYAATLPTASNCDEVVIFIGFKKFDNSWTYIQGDTQTSGINGDIRTKTDRVEVIAEAPANTKGARVITRYRAASNATMVARLAKPQMCFLPSDSSDPPPYEDGRGSDDELVASSVILQDAFIDSSGQAIAKIVLEAAAGGGNPARIGLRDSSDGSSIALVAEQIFFGDDTVFEDTYNTIYTESGGYRLRILGPFPGSGNLVIWYGSDSVSLNSETKTNGIFALATDGKVYFGSSPVGAQLSASASGSGSGSRSGAGSVTTSSRTISVSGGISPYTYAWSMQSADLSWAFTSGSSSSTTMQTTIGALEDKQIQVVCKVTDSAGAVIYVPTFFRAYDVNIP